MGSFTILRSMANYAPQGSWGVQQGECKLNCTPHNEKTDHQDDDEENPYKLFQNPFGEILLIIS